MELALNEINLAKQADQQFIVPAMFAKQFGLSVSNAAFRVADMTGYTKRGSVWFKD